MSSEQTKRLMKPDGFTLNEEGVRWQIGVEITVNLLLDEAEKQGISLGDLATLIGRFANNDASRRIVTAQIQKELGKG